MRLAKKILGEDLAYDGSQIAGQWALRTFGIERDSAVCFLGACDVQPERMVDLEDLLAGCAIRADRMMHLIVEHFDCTLRLATTRQRLLAALAAEEITARSGVPIRREGDDLYDGSGKLSISVAVRTSVSVKIHFGINVINAGTPVETKALIDYTIDPLDFGRTLVDRYEREIDGIDRALSLVRGVE